MDWRHGIDVGRYWLGVILAVSLPPAIAYWFIVHPFIAFWRRMGPRLTFGFLGTFYLVVIVALVPLRDFLLGRDLGTHVLPLLFAVPLLFVSSRIRRLRSKHLKFRTLAGIPELSPQGAGPGLLQEGIYSYMRHPRYAEFILGLSGWALVVNFLGFYVEAALSIGGLLVIVEIEERELSERFGQAYVDYCARVPRFFPRKK
jgi:protein-S-isoprenylcysteine O-methyltransferase Ste14